MRPFRDRAEAGQRLAEKLTEHFATKGGGDRPVVLALPRGGVPVAFEVARAFRAPLDLLMVRKIGVPAQPELAAAAVVNGDAAQMVVNDEIVQATGISAATLEEAKARELAEIERRRAAYLGDRAAASVEGRDAIVVDDGIATGATARAALLGLRARAPRSLTLAVPVAPADTVRALAAAADVVALRQPAPFGSIGWHYQDFHQLEDAEVSRLLDEARRFAPKEP